MPTELSDIELEEVSLVDEPASIGASVVIYKRHTPDGDKGNGGLPTLLSKSSNGSLPIMTVSAKTTETGIVSFRKSAKGTETVEVRKEDYLDAMGAAGDDADDSLTPVMEELHGVIQKINAATASPEEKAQAITTNFQQAMQLLSQGLMGAGDEPGLIEKCLTTGATLVLKVGSVEPDKKVEKKDAAAGGGDTVSGAAGDKVEKKDDDEMANEEVVALRKRLAELEDKGRLEDIKSDLRKAKIPLEHADTLLKLEKVDKAAAESMLKGLTALAGQVDHTKFTTESGASGDGNVSKAGKARLDSAIVEIQKMNPKLSREQAFAKALSEDRELVAAYDRGELS